MKTWTPQEIKELRLRKGISQNSFSELLGVTRVYVNYLEKGVKTPSKTLRLLLDCIEKETGTKKKGVKTHG